MSSCLLIQRTSKHLGHNSSAHFSGQAILSVLSNLPKGQEELKVGQGKEKTLVPTGQMHLEQSFSLALYSLAHSSCIFPAPQELTHKVVAWA